MKRRPEIIILNIDAPELAKFLSMGLKGSRNDTEKKSD